MNFIKLLLIASVAFLFSACGEEASAPAASSSAAAPAASDDSSSSDSGASAILSTIERAEGVVYQDEIYK